MDQEKIELKSANRPGPKGRREGGRAARKAARGAGAAGLAVRPGMEGGQYKPLSEEDIKRIHTAALDVLEQIGVADPIPEMLEYALPGGCTLDDAGRLLFPRALIEDLIDVAAKDYVLYAPDPNLSYEIKGRSVLLATSGEAVSVLDFDSQTYRPSLLCDLYDAARLADCMEHIHNFGQPFIATEWSHDLFVHDINAAYAELAGTRKPLALGVGTAEHIGPLIRLFDLYVGKEGGFLERPFCQFGRCPIVSPLRFAKDSAEVLVEIAKLGLVVDVAVAAQAGATAPASLAGALVQTFAETLACLAIANMITPGIAMNFGMWPFISDLRTGAFSGGSGEEALVTAAATQLVNHFGLITSVPSGMTDSKTMDAQAGYEKAITTTAAVLAGGNIVSPYPGVVGSLLAQSFEGMVIDNDMMGQVLRLLRGIEITDETTDINIIRNAVSGVGHYLDQPQTLELMQSEFLYPEIGDRRTAAEWHESGKQTIYELAHTKVVETLSSHYPEYIPPKVDAAMRAEFPIQLAERDMKPGNGRWV